MPKPSDRAPNTHPPVRRHMPRPIPPRQQRWHSLDPVSGGGGRRSLLSGGNITLFPVMLGFGLYALAQVPAVDRLFKYLQASSRAPSGLLYWLPAGLVICAAAALGAVAFFSLRSASRRKSHPSVDSRIIRAALANVARASAKRSALQTSAVRKVSALVSRTRHTAQAKVSLIRPAHKQRPAEWMEAARVRRAALESAKVRAAAADQKVAEMPPPDSPALSESLPTLPIHHPVRRRSPRGTLPPAVAAALKLEVASQKR